MKPEDGMQEQSAPEPIVRTQLTRMLESPIFSRAGRVSRLLQYLVVQALAGQASELTEKAIGQKLYVYKENNFDPTVNTDVRVDIRELRRKLLEYYVEFPDDAVHISVPGRTFVPRFRLTPLKTLDGFWEAHVTYQSAAMTFPRDVPGNEVFEFEIDGDQLHGAASFRGLMRGLFDGKLNGNRLSFITKGRDSGNRQVEISYRGTHSGDEIAFVLVVNADTWAPVPIRFVATRGAINQKLAE